MSVHIVARTIAARTHRCNAHFVECLAAIVGDVESDAENINAVVVVRVDPNLAEIQRAWILVAHLCPMSAGILGAKQSAFLLVLNQCVDNVWIPPVNIQPNSAEWTGGNSVREFAPRPSGISGFEQAAAGAAAIE